MVAKKSGKKPTASTNRSQSKTSASASQAKKPANERRKVNWRVIAIVVAVVVVVGVASFFPIALATDESTFCKSCHSMQPFYDAFRSGAHPDLQCIDCHVDPGYQSRFLHKFSTFEEIYAQLFTSPAFPNYNAEIPNARCLRCHSSLPTRLDQVDQFSHRMHLSRNIQCISCHATVGHKVTFAALSSAGLLNKRQVPAGATFVGEVFAGTPGKHSALPGHKPVPCANCHDQANVQCSACHTPPPNHYSADCKLCHKPNVAFSVFNHPPSGEHKYTSRPCTKCHPTGYDTVYCSCHPGGRPPKDD